nr:hypothetical protein SHINE37_60054 [Rhizobiaceae bacterium]
MRVYRPAAPGTSRSSCRRRNRGRHRQAMQRKPSSQRRRSIRTAGWPGSQHVPLCENDFGHNAPSVGKPMKLNNHRDHLLQVVDDFVLLQPNATLHDHQGQAVIGVACGIRVDRGQRARMSGVNGLEEGKRLFAAKLAEHHPIRPHPERRFQQLLWRHLRPPLVTLRCEQGNGVRRRRSQLARVLDRHDALLARNLLQKRVEEGGLAGRGAPGHGDRNPRTHGGPEKLHDVDIALQHGGKGLFGRRKPELAANPCIVEGAAALVDVQADVVDDLLADRDRAAGRCRRRQHALEALAGRKRGRQDGVFLVDDLVGEAGHPFAQRPDPVGGKLRVDNTFHAGVAKSLDEHFTGAIDRNFGDAVVRKERLQPFKSFIEKRELLHL